MSILLTVDALSTATTGQLSTESDRPAGETSIRAIEWHARARNRGLIVVGIADVSASHGRELSPDERVTWNFSNLGDGNTPGYVKFSDFHCHIVRGGDILDYTLFLARD